MREFVAGYFIDESKGGVYYLRKKTLKFPFLNGKLIGIGGEIDITDCESCFNALQREVFEELDVRISLQGLINQGFFIDPFGYKINLIKTFCKYDLPLGSIENEGDTSYFPLNFHRSSLNDFLPYAPIFLDKLLFTDDVIEMDFRNV